MRFILAIGVTLGVTILVLIFAVASAPIRGLPEWELMVAFLTILAGSIAFVATVYRYKKPKADEALVRTGGGRAKVTIGAGLQNSPCKNFPAGDMKWLMRSGNLVGKIY